MSGRLAMRGFVVLCLAGCPSEDAPLPDTGEEDTALDWSALDDPLDADFAFCHVPGRGGLVLREYCAWVQTLPQDVCPAAHVSCERPEEIRPELTCTPAGTAAPSEGAAGGPGTPEMAVAPWTEDDLSCDCEPLDTPETPDLDAARLWRVLLAVGVALVLGLVALAIVRRLGWGRGIGVGRAALSVQRAPEAPVDAYDGLSAASEDSLLAAAEAALLAGDWAQAVRLSRGAVLRRLGRAGVLRLHPSATDREYLRSADGQGPAEHGLKTVVRAAEHERWALAEVPASLAEAAVGAARQVLQAVVLGCLCWVMPAEAGDRYGVDGDAALGRVLTEAGAEVVWLTELTEASVADLDVLVLASYTLPPADDEAFEAVLSLLNGTQRLIWVNGRWAGSPLFGRASTVAGEAQALHDTAIPVASDPSELSAAAEALQWAVSDGFVVSATQDADTLAVWQVDPKAPALPDVLPVPVGFTAWPERVQPVWMGDHAGQEVVLAARQPAPMSDIVWLSSPALTHNITLASAAHRQALAHLMLSGVRSRDGRRGPLRVGMALTPAVMSADQGNSATNLAASGLLPFALQLLALWALTAWAFGVRRVPLRTAADGTAVDGAAGDGHGSEPRAAFAEHVRAVARQLQAVDDRVWAARSSVRFVLLHHGERAVRRAMAQAGYEPARAAALWQTVSALADGQPVDEQDAVQAEDELWKLMGKAE